MGDLKFKEWLESRGDLSKAAALKTSLVVEQKASLNDARATRFREKMTEVCGGQVSEQSMLGEERHRMEAELSRRNAMSFLQMGATVATDDAKVAAEDQKIQETLGSFCEKQKSLTLASLAAAQAAHGAEQKQNAYLEMAREVQSEASNAAVSATNRRHSTEE